MEIVTLDSHRQLYTMISPYKHTQRKSSKGCLFSSEKTYDMEC